MKMALLALLAFGFQFPGLGEEVNEPPPLPLTQITIPPLFDGEKLQKLDMPKDGRVELKGWVKNGKATVYTLPVKKGQVANIAFTATNKAALLIFFDLARPDDDAIYSSDLDGRTFKITAQSDTIWLVRPFFSLIANRRGPGAQYKIDMQLTPPNP
jgi:hypothetical protein